MLKSTQVIVYGIHSCGLGRVVIGQTSKGLCWLGFMVNEKDGAYKGDGLTRMKSYFPDSVFVEDSECKCLLSEFTHTPGTENITETKSYSPTGQTLRKALTAWENDDLKSIGLDLHGTQFQNSVWRALLDIPKGKTRSYGDIAVEVGRPKAYRAVGTAVGDNPISLIVPCHRVIQKSGKLGNYGWGLHLKRQLLDIEGA
eukprot:CFRG2625T1